MIIIADSSALVSLSVCNSLSLLEPLFGEIYVPEAVYNEVSVEGKIASESLISFLENHVKSVSLEEFPVIKPEGLGYGELEAMALYSSLSADLLLIDDARAKKVAYLNGMEVMGSLGVLLMAKRKKLLPKIKPLLELLSLSDVYFGDSILKKVQVLAGE